MKGTRDRKRIIWLRGLAENERKVGTVVELANRLYYVAEITKDAAVLLPAAQHKAGAGGAGSPGEPAGT